VTGDSWEFVKEAFVEMGHDTETGFFDQEKLENLH